MSRLKDFYFMPNKHRGTAELIKDLEHLLRKAKDCVYDDFMSDLTLPKTALVNDLNHLMQKTLKGDYDN